MTALLLIFYWVRGIINKIIDERIIMLQGNLYIISAPSGAGKSSLIAALLKTTRSEERRVGKECRSRWSPYH